jgi:hypothetical protein
MKSVIKGRIIGRYWSYRINKNYFKNGFSYEDVEKFIKTLPTDKVKIIKNLYHFCIDDLTNNEKVWLKKSWVNKDNSKEYALASVIKILNINLSKNLIFNKKKLEEALKNINKISDEELNFIKIFK